MYCVRLWYRKREAAEGYSPQPISLEAAEGPTAVAASCLCAIDKASYCAPPNLAIACNAYHTTIPRVVAIIVNKCCLTQLQICCGGAVFTHSFATTRSNTSASVQSTYPTTYQSVEILSEGSLLLTKTQIKRKSKSSQAASSRPLTFAEPLIKLTC